ncbi:protein of unknown function DUF4220 [Cynara cardunculus var. scolymus]|uniref:DUF4220 domain-containing protein n=1 Tax=Cynara cardunculus var. scolymus TaxID=59895 RepID=A0A103Y1V9_CYNCS|nr:protein of unknown function DUF4220 [Cynara cardunculus var. scolymus]
MSAFRLVTAKKMVFSVGQSMSTECSSLFQSCTDILQKLLKYKMTRIMVDIPIPPKWKQLWDTWDLRSFIILSLSLQTFLIFFAPLRKRTKSNWIIMPLWSAYLLADWAANFAVGLISNSQGNPGGGTGKKERAAVENEDLLAFWAPFLLVHLGGPDTITAFALEDNELWLRHLLGLMFQCLAAVYVFVQSLPRNRLWVPTMLMFITGIMKYAERTRSLYLASADRFKDSMLRAPDAGPNYAKLMGEYFSKKEAKLPTRIEMIREPDRAAKSANKAKKGNLTELEIVQYAHAFFENFKGLVVDMIFSRRERNQSRDFFLNRTAKDAFKVVEVELNFIYEVLFTKLPVVYGYFGTLSRFFSLATVCSAIVLFIFKNKSNFSAVDVTITYGLLFGALVLDITALIMLIFSDWTIIFLRKSPDGELDKSIKTRFITLVLRFMTEGTLRDPKDNARRKTSEPQTRKWTIQVLKRRWSESISTYNLIYYCLHPRSYLQQLVYEKLGISGFLDSIKYVKPRKFTIDVRDFIFEELKLKSELADDLETAKEISSARGDWVLRVEDGWSSLLRYVIDVDYDQSLLLWHIATELCYNDELHRGISITTANQKHRENAKLLSDYMFYLLIMQPNMMSAIAGIGQIRFRDTCAEAKNLFESVKRREEEQKATPPTTVDGMDLEQINACIEILGVSTDVPPVTVKGDQSKSLLFDGCILAKTLMEIEGLIDDPVIGIT